MADWFYIGYCTVMAMFAVAAAYAAAFGFRALRRSHGGYYNDVTKGGYLSHCAAAGAGEWNRVDASGFWCYDKAGHAGRYEQPWLDGWKEWPIPIGWGSNRILLGQFDVPPTTQKFSLTSNGVFSIRKFGFEANRGILDVVPTIRRAVE